jgi:DNA processing protein
MPEYEYIPDLSEANSGVISSNDSEFPPLLAEIDNPPARLWYMGDISSLTIQPCIAIVGTRTPTEFGMEMAFTAGEVLARAGFTIVSGLALGCDTAAHQGCLSGRGRTVAFLANGLHTIYPPSNSGLAAEMILSSGCIISEYPPKTKLHPAHFKNRNRLQSGSSIVTIVIESDLKSGTMYTAKFAQSQGRKLLVLNHPQDKRSPMSEGNKKLLDEGYAIPFNPEDIERLGEMVG